MSFLGFLAAVVKAISWPAIVLLILTRFRGEVSQLLKSLRSVKVSSLELKFGEDLDEAELESANIKTPSIKTAPYVGRPSVVIPTFPNAPPEKRITKAWYLVRRELAKLAGTAGMPDVNERLPLQSLKWLEKNGKLDAATVATTRKLKKLRDTMRAGGGAIVIDAEQADTFDALAAKVVEAFEAAT